MIYETVHLAEIAYARSGDKGVHANIGVIAYTKEGYHFLIDALTEERVHEFFAPLQPIKTIRYELPNLLAVNFVLEGVLGLGGSRSLRIDAQGKALGQILLEMEIKVPENLLSQCRRC